MNIIFQIKFFLSNVANTIKTTEPADSAGSVLMKPFIFEKEQARVFEILKLEFG